ncbi:chitooligosaccharidolytic beta-N-acetylglucosaminidase [Microplitis demolitor]|uniref:chitooligosaccharidolytic beta-N-acetylglucosaminidase n=1 Tax=Microplitis demolitor TaxID=69319 RepID=UPI0004CCE2AD|nr:chitooligosaccharidolytic beta-N-acetylglucosaminidase [Microplitis demolitor]
MFGVLITILVFQSFCTHAQIFSSPWNYKCTNGQCVKFETIKNESISSLEACQLLCGDGGLWPKPTGPYYIGNSLVNLNPSKIKLHLINSSSIAGDLLKRKVNALKMNLKKFIRNPRKLVGLGLDIYIKGLINDSDMTLRLSTKESYKLKINKRKSSVSVIIRGENYFGVRNALETLSQLIVFNDFVDKIQIATNVSIIDGPVYPYRGILLDTSRNYISKEEILKTIEAMGMSKLNTFHWHLSDSQSFPYVSRSWPNMSRYGAYSSNKIYTEKDIKEIVSFGIYQGVRVIPELDAPAHVGEGWQWVGDDALACFRGEPWPSYCQEPPCGQLNPASNRVYEVLESLYKDLMDDFKPVVFHMGGDEVNINCWNSSESIRKFVSKKGWSLDASGFVKLWLLFQQRAYDKLKLAGGGEEVKAVLWTSKLTDENNIEYLDPDKYIIQIWTAAYDDTISRLLQNDFQVIFSNYDALYLDCGFGAWIGEGSNWCSPYKGWKKIYENSPLKIVKEHGVENKKHLILGGEVALWTEQVDSTSVDSRLWPRSAALAERLWAEPSSSWRNAEPRILRHRERLVTRGILADSLEPEWCRQNPGNCN